MIAFDCCWNGQKFLQTHGHRAESLTHSRGKETPSVVQKATGKIQRIENTDKSKHRKAEKNREKKDKKGKEEKEGKKKERKKTNGKIREKRKRSGEGKEKEWNNGNKMKQNEREKQQ